MRKEGIIKNFNYFYKKVLQNLSIIRVNQKIKIPGIKN